ncbi:MAG: CHASE2 domain-containing protein [Candidatus Thorarchaeota archaeon]
MKDLNRIIKICAINIGIAVILSVLFSIGFLSNVQLSMSDNLYGGKVPLDSIIIVAIDDESLQEIGRWPWDRNVFAELIPLLNQSKVIGVDVAFFETQTTEIDTALGDAVSRNGNVVLPVEYREFDVRDGMVYGEKVMVTVPEIAYDARALAYINVVTDFDGKTRATNPNVQGDYNSFAYEVYRNFWKVPIEGKIESFENRLLVNYVGKANTFPQYSISKILSGEIPLETFKNKAVLIGATSPDLHDEAIVPNSALPMPGVEIHANTIQTLITQSFLHKESDLAVILTIVVLAIITALLFFYMPLWLSILLLVAVIILYLFFAIFMFNQGIIVNLIYVPLTLIVSYLTTTIYHYISEKKQRRQVLGAFEKYVSKDVISHIMANPGKLKLGGERREITVFFSDIRGFTTISEALGPEKLVALLNEYLTEMTNIILDHNGVVDKYMGDAIMAFWGAPLDQPKHAERAAQASLAMDKRLKELQKKWEKDGVPPLEIGIGLNSGFAVVGNMGAEDRFDYTAMGDTVNLGARLESINKQYGTRMLISEHTNKKLSGKHFMTRLIDKVTVKGKTEPVTIYELSGHKTTELEWHQPMLDKYEEAMNFYFDQKWDKAIKSFKECMKIRIDGKEDGPSLTFIERCEYFKKNSPGPKWNGVCVMKTK